MIIDQEEEGRLIGIKIPSELLLLGVTLTLTDEEALNNNNQ